MKFCFIEYMKPFLRRLRLWILHSFGFLQKHVGKAILFAEAIKTVVNHPGVNLFVLSSKNKTDDIILNFLKAYIDDFLKALNTGKECLDKTELSEKVTCFVEKLSQYPSWIQDAVYLNLASKIIMKEQGLSKYEAHTIVQNYYHSLKANDRLPKFDLSEMNIISIREKK